MHSTLVSLVFMLATGTIAAFEHNYTQDNSSMACKVGGFFDVTQALLNDTLYQQVLDCTHQQDVQDWNYSTEVIFDATEYTEYTAYTACALVSYTAVIDSPTVLSMSARFPISVQKHVCLDGPILIETVTVTAPLMMSVNMTSRYVFHDTYAEIASEFHCLSPWYLKFLFDVPDYIRSVHNEQVYANVQSFCSHLTTVKRLSAPQHMYLGESNLNFLPGILW
jgi:hypothetical protein